MAPDSATTAGPAPFARPAHPPRPVRRDRHASLARALAVLTTTIAVLAAMAGTVLWQERVAAREAVPRASAEAGGVRTEVRQAAWSAMANHHTDDGFQMPSSMMPGAPEGDNQRLGVPVTLVNTEDESTGFSVAEEFFLIGGKSGRGRADGAGKPVPLHSDTIGELPRLAPGSAVRGVLYFDIEPPEPGDPPLRVLWKRDGDTRQLTVSLTGDPAHGH